MRMNIFIVTEYILFLHISSLYGVCVATKNNLLDDIIQKRNLREDGYTSFRSASFELNHHVDDTFRSVHARYIRDIRTGQKKTVDDQSTFPIKMHIYEDTKNAIVLELDYAKAVMANNAEVKLTSSSKTTFWKGDIPDCFMVGHVKNSPDDTAIVSYCYNLTGVFHMGNLTYWFEVIDEVDNNKTQKQQVLLARKEKATPYNPYEQSVGPSVEIEQKSRPRVTRSVHPNLTIEIAVILDADYVANVKSRGRTSTKDIIELMVLIWTGVQAEWSKSDVLGYTVTIEIKVLEIWETNPQWYNPSTLVDWTLRSLCYGANAHNMYTEYDHLHLFTGKKGTDVSGMSYVGKICTARQKCGVSTKSAAEDYVTTAHELGHNVGMRHDSEVGCPSPNDGIMGTKTSGWSTCSIKSLHTFLNSSTAGCLYSTDVNKTVVVPVQGLWPGMLYSDDEICEYNYGQGYRYRSFPYREWGECTMHSCINMKKSSVQYGVSFSQAKPVDGRYCGQHKVCSSNIVGGGFRCISWNETGLNTINTSLFTEVIGGWSEWGALTLCSRTCGTGVQYRQRICNNPKPKLSGACKGDEYLATVCNTKACIGDSADHTLLINKRAGETCSYWKSHKLYEVIGQNSSMYRSTGSMFAGINHGQCEVKCDAVSGFKVPNFQRFGLMPDGTPCIHESLSFIEVNNLPRTPGRFSKCVQGYCHLFEVSNRTRVDGCGIGGGNNSTCIIVDGVYNKTLNSNDRATIAVVPARAFRIQFYFVYTTMPRHYLELRSKSGTAVIANAVPGVSMVTNTMANPVYFAGTYWYYMSSQQYLYTDGTINQAVIIQLLQYGNRNNTGVHFAYSKPLSACPTRHCQHAGIWNVTTCSCDCVHGYYGIDCSDTCNNYCKNGQSFMSSCQCHCLGNTYGNMCNCRYPFTGQNCKDCKISSCQNGGIFNRTSCRCRCQPGYGGLDCSSPCQDANGNSTACAIYVSKGWCDSRNEQLEADCYKSCGLCHEVSVSISPHRTTTKTSKVHSTVRSSLKPNVVSMKTSTANTTPSKPL